jgi:pyrimidine operon attenuation protein / uracil phosphoribosyltransferase
MTEKKRILDAVDIERMLTRMAYEMLEAHKNLKTMALVGIHTRGVYLAQRLLAIIGRIEQTLEDMPSGSIDINLYRDDWTRITHHPVVQETRIPFSVDGRHIILVDDVLFTGRTTRAAMDALIDFGRPDRIELAVLIDRGHRELPIEPNYVGKYMETPRAASVNVLLNEQDGEDAVYLEAGSQ